MIFILIVVVIFFYLKFVIHLKVDFKSFFRRGFSKIDDLFGLILFVGKQGKGKTYSAIQYIEELKTDNTIILTNVKSYFDNLVKQERNKGTIENSGENEIELKGDYSNAYYFADFNQLVRFANSLKDRNFIVFFDEIFSVLEKKGALNKQSLTFISQLRKRGVILVSTAQEWSEINITFRRYCRFKVDCNMFGLPFIHTAFLLNKVCDGDLIYWDKDLQDHVAPTIETNFRKGNKYIIDLYDTYETIAESSSINYS